MLLAISRSIDTLSRHLGQLVAWLTLAMMLVTTLVVLLRYGLETGSLVLQESITFMHVAVFMLGAALTLQQDGHVRVDIFYQRLSGKGKATVNLIGTLLFLFPFCLFMGWISWDYLAASWELKERSPDAGLPLYPLKALLILMPATLFLQGLSELIRSLLVLKGDTSQTSSHHEAVL